MGQIKIKYKHGAIKEVPEYLVDVYLATGRFELVDVKDVNVVKEIKVEHKVEEKKEKSLKQPKEVQEKNVKNNT